MTFYLFVVSLVFCDHTILSYVYADRLETVTVNVQIKIMFCSMFSKKQIQLLVIWYLLAGQILCSAELSMKKG